MESSIHMRLRGQHAHRFREHLAKARERRQLSKSAFAAELVIEAMLAREDRADKQRRELGR